MSAPCPIASLLPTHFSTPSTAPRVLLHAAAHSPTPARLARLLGVPLLQGRQAAPESGGHLRWCVPGRGGPTTSAAPHDLVATVDEDEVLIVLHSRHPQLQGLVLRDAGAELAAALLSPAPPPTRRHAA